MTTLRINYWNRRSVALKNEPNLFGSGGIHNLQLCDLWLFEILSIVYWSEAQNAFFSSSCNMFMNLTSFAAGEGSNILQKAKLTAVALRECNVTYLTRTNKYLQSTQICAADKKSDTCQVIFTALNFTNLCIFWNFFRECYKLKDIWNIP